MATARILTRYWLLFSPALLTLCSCQALGPKPASMATDAKLPASAAAAPIVAGRDGFLPHAPAKASTSDKVISSQRYPVQRARYVPAAGTPGAVTPGTLPQSMWTGDPHQGYSHGHCPHCQGSQGPFQFSQEATNLSWVPDGIACPWPKDEFLCDGGDKNDDVHVKQDWTVVGLDREDTVAHYDTLDGQTEVTKSNCVCIYAPRFAAVRKVSSPVFYEAHERIAGVEKPTKLNIHEDLDIATTAVQPEQAVAQLGVDQGIVYRDRTQGIRLDHVLSPAAARNGFLPYEDFLAIRRGEYQASEKARLAERAQAAVVWQSTQAVQVLIDNVMAVEAVGDAKVQETKTYELLGKPRLKICKIASTSEAQVGELVEFTLRFDNVGDQKIGNVTIIDSLTNRLEYVEGSANCSLKANFMTQPNDGESLVLRWEIIDPLAVNEGGIIRFVCRVR